MKPKPTARKFDVSRLQGLAHHAAIGLQAVELRRTIEMLSSLTDEQWFQQTDCPEWDVHRMYLHVLGACEAGASVVENTRQTVKALRYRRVNGGALEAALSAVQVRDRQTVTAPTLLKELRAVAPRTLRKRESLPRLLRRHAAIPIDGPVAEKWPLGYLVDTIYLRDMWMHRIDAARATGSELVLSADHDGVIVADIVAEWAQRHGKPVRLSLTGVAGGTFQIPANATIKQVDAGEFDAVEFCRIMAGRSTRPANELFATVVPF